MRLYCVMGDGNLLHIDTTLKGARDEARYVTGNVHIEEWRLEANYFVYEWDCPND